MLIEYYVAQNFYVLYKILKYQLIHISKFFEILFYSNQLQLKFLFTLVHMQIDFI